MAYPAALAVCAALGFFFPRHAWRWPLVLFLAQFVAMVLRNGELGNLWPLGILLHCAFSSRFGLRSLQFVAQSTKRAISMR